MTTIYNYVYLMHFDGSNMRNRIFVTFIHICTSNMRILTFSVFVPTYTWRVAWLAVWEKLAYRKSCSSEFYLGPFETPISHFALPRYNYLAHSMVSLYTYIHVGYIVLQFHINIQSILIYTLHYIKHSTIYSHRLYICTYMYTYVYNTYK